MYTLLVYSKHVKKIIHTAILGRMSIWPDPNQCFLKWTQIREMEIEVDPDRGFEWIRIRPNVVDPVGSGSGSATLVNLEAFCAVFILFCTFLMESENFKCRREMF